MTNISESLRKQREQLLSDTSEELLGRHTSLLDIAIISLYNRLVNRLNLDTDQFRSGGAVLALGAFGRSLIGPDQPVSILFLRTELLPWKENWLDEITLPLSEAGWVVDPLQGTIESLVERGGRDFSFLLRLLESRYVSGSRQLADQLDKALESLVEERRDELLGRLFESVQARQAGLEDSQSWLEPDLETNPGGLGEIGSIRAACRMASSVRNLDDAIFRGYLTRQEVDFLLGAEKTYGRLLSLLGSLTGNTGGVLRFDQQESLAAKLGYSARIGFLPVEAFMQQVYQLFHGVICISGEFWERLQEIRLSGEEVEEVAGEVLEEGLVVRAGKIHVQTGRYTASAGHLVRLFRLAAQQGLGIANVTRQWIHHHRNGLDTAAGDPMVKDELFDLIRSDGPALKVLRRFYNQGLLTSLIPELAAVHGLVQHDAFHLYPVHEHHLRTVSELKRLLAGDYSEVEPELTQMARGLGNPVLLLLAGLLHDIGKSSGTGHALHGGEMIPAIARRLGLDSEESDTVQFLVAQHLLLMDSASMRDLADQEMLAHCALIVSTVERLDLLALLSFADMAATGPKARLKWRDTPVMLLYERVCHLLEKGEPSPQAISERIDHVRAQVRHELGGLLNNAELEDYFGQLAPRYLFSMSPGAIARHMGLQKQLHQSEKSFVWETKVKDGSAEITLLSRQIPGLLSRAAGILTLHDMNINEAQIFTMHNDLILLIFQCRLVEPPGKVPDWEKVRSDMERLLQGRMALDYRISAHAAGRKHPGAPARHVASQILIDNHSSEVYTILEVYTLDRVGLLYSISRTLLELQIRIYVAKITTKVDQVADVFYIKTRLGEKVTDPEQIDEIKNALRFWLDGPLPG